METCSQITTKDRNVQERTKTTKIDILGSLPLEIVQELLLYLPYQDFRQFWFCCKRWRNRTRGNYFWKKRCENDNYKAIKSDFLDKLTASRSFSYWEGVYRYHELLKYNWKNNIFKKTILHFETSMFSGYFDDEWIILVAQKSKLVVIEYSTMTIKYCLLINSGDFIRNIIKRKDLLICLTSSYVLKVWNLQNGSIVMEKEFLTPIEEIEAHENLIAYVYETGELQVLNVDTGRIEYNYQDEHVSYIFFRENSLIFLPDSDEINILNLNDKSVTKLQSCTPHSSERVEVYKNYLLICNVFGRVCIWNLDTKSEIVHHLFVGAYIAWNTNLEFLDESKFMCVDDYHKELHIWDFKTCTRVTTIMDVKNFDKIVSNSRHIIISGLFDHYLRIYCLSTGDYVGAVKIQLDCFDSRLDIVLTESKILIQSSSYFDAKCVWILDYEKINKKKTLENLL